MTIIKSSGAGDPVSTGFYSHTIDQSLRFTSGDSAYLSRTPASAGNRDVNTTSFWVKRANLGSNQAIFSAGSSFPSNHNNSTVIQFRSNDTLRYRSESGGSAVAQLDTTRVFRDVSSWYHIVLTYESTNSTSTDRIKLYVNGVRETAFNVETYPNSGVDNFFASDSVHQIGRSTANYIDCYLAEVNFLDGLAYDPSYFGETKDGVWVPKAYSGSHGTNGFHLPFDDSSAIGDDESANTNDFTSNNLVASDVVPDSPTNNWSVMNPLKVNNTSFTFSEGNLDIYSAQTGTNPAMTSTFAVSTGKWYWESYIRARGNASNIVGIASHPNDLENQNYSGFAQDWMYGYMASGNKRNNNTGVSYGNTWTTGDIIGVALDLDAGAVYFYKNGSIQNSGTAAYTGLSGLFSAYNLVYAGGAQVLNFGQDDTFADNKTSGSAAASDGNGLGTFYYSVPSGYNSLCASNLPDPTIGPGQSSQADDNFNTVLYTGNGSTQSITGVGFQPDWTWLKSRSAAQGHNVFDVIRGANKALFPNDSNAEFTDTDRLNSFDSDGFSLGADANINTSSATYVSWNWKAGGSASSNSNGTITSSVSANQDAGFSIVSWTGTGSAGTIGHGLSSAPEHIIVKNRDSTAGRIWLNYVKAAASDAETDYLSLNGTGATVDNADIWNDTAPTSTVFSVGSNASANESADEMIAYCFHSVEGYSRAGSYVGNNSTDGPFSFTGFKPAFLLLKRKDSAASWLIYDNKRDTYNQMQYPLFPDLSNAEYTSNLLHVDFLSNGFKIRNATYGETNVGTYIYLAFAEAPFKFANAR